MMKPIPGITQITTLGNCSNPFVLGYQQSCILNLRIDGSAIQGRVQGGPAVCQQGNLNQCYQPNRANSLEITQVQTSDYTIGGSVSGLSGTLVLQNNGSDALTLNADGTYAFSSALPPGSAYSVTVQSQPGTQTCTVNNSSGTVQHANITNINVTCSTNTRTVGGSVSGLATSEVVVLQNNGSDTLLVNSNGPFTFSTAIAQGAPYNVTILTQPTTQTCTLVNGNGTAGTSNITNVQVICATNAYTVGGSISGLSDSVSLENNNTDSLTTSSNGTFTFSTPIAEGAPYQVTVSAQPTGQTCTVTNGSGTMGGGDVSNVTVSCVINQTTLSTSVSELALSITGLTEYGITPTTSGVARVITITNTGSDDALGFQVAYSGLPSGTTHTGTCDGLTTLAHGASCTIQINPGATATSNNSGVSCSNGTEPVLGTVEVSSTTASTVSTSVVVLDYGCVYQSGYVYALDDNPPASESVGGKVVTRADQAPAPPPFPSNGVIWSSNASGDVVKDVIYGISETSTTSTPDPSTGQVQGQVACNGALDGACNTSNIYIYYPNPPINLTNYAVGLCKQTIDNYSDWYLPAICEWGYDSNGSSGSGCGSSINPTLQNILSNLVEYNSLNLLYGFYWSSTEVSADAQNEAWLQHFDFSGTNNYQDVSNKADPWGVRCSRLLTN